MVDFSSQTSTVRLHSHLKVCSFIKRALKLSLLPSMHRFAKRVHKFSVTARRKFPSNVFVYHNPTKGIVCHQSYLSILIPPPQHRELDGHIMSRKKKFFSKITFKLTPLSRVTFKSKDAFTCR